MSSENLEERPCIKHYPWVHILSTPGTFTGRYQTAILRNMANVQSDIYQLRRENLRRLINEKFDRKQKRLADAIERQPDYISRILKGHKNLGEDLARTIETMLNLEQGWLDRRPSIAEDAADYRPTMMRRTTNAAEPGPDIEGRVPLISWTTAGHWADIVDNFQPGDAEDWIPVTISVGPRAYALRIRGDSMEPVIPDGAIVIVDPDAEPHHRSVVIVRQKQDTEATCKRLMQEGSRWYLQPDNPRYQAMELAPDAVICGVVRQVIKTLP